MIIDYCGIRHPFFCTTRARAPVSYKCNIHYDYELCQINLWTALNLPLNNLEVCTEQSVSLRSDSLTFLPVLDEVVRSEVTQCGLSCSSQDCQSGHWALLQAGGQF